MSDLQITVAVVIVALGVVAAALFSWGISGLFPTARKKPQDAPAPAEDYATKLTRENLAAKRDHNGD